MPCHSDFYKLCVVDFENSAKICFFLWGKPSKNICDSRDLKAQLRGPIQKIRPAVGIYIYILYIFFWFFFFFFSFLLKYHSIGFFAILSLNFLRFFGFSLFV